MEQRHPECDTATSRLGRRYLREFVPAIAAYVAVLLASVWLLRALHGPVALRAAIALTPLLPIALALRAIVRYIRGCDEMQRQIELEAVAIATGLVSMAYLAGGFLQLARVIAVPSGVAMIWVFPLVCASYGLAKAAVQRRYR